LREAASGLLATIRKKQREAAFEAQAIHRNGGREEAEGASAAQAAPRLQQSLERRQRLARERIGRRDARRSTRSAAAAVDVRPIDRGLRRVIVFSRLDERRGAGD